MMTGSMLINGIKMHAVIVALKADLKRILKLQVFSELQERLFAR